MQTSISLALKYISWLKNSEGIAISDKFLIFFVKLIYLSLRVPFLVLGKERSNRFLARKGLDFGTFWNKSFKFLRRDKKQSELLKFKMPKYDYQFYCRINNTIFKL